MGKVDEVRVWGVALSARQLAEFSFLSGNAVRAAHPAAAALAGYYRFNEGNGTVAHDWSVHRRDLALRRGYAVITSRRLPDARRLAAAAAAAAAAARERVVRLGDAFYGLRGEFYGVSVVAARGSQDGGGGGVDEQQKDAEEEITIEGAMSRDSAEEVVPVGSPFRSAWMEGVGKYGCCVSGCRLCEGGFSVKTNTVGGRVAGM